MPMKNISMKASDFTPLPKTLQDTTTLPEFLHDRNIHSHGVVDQAFKNRTSAISLLTKKLYGILEQHITSV